MADGSVPAVTGEKHAGGRPSKYDPSMHEVIIALGQDGAGRAEMAVAIGISRETWNDWTSPKSERFNPEFSDAVKKALSASQSWWERRGREATFDSKDFSATSYIFQMKNRFREDWSDRTVNEHVGKDDGPIDVKDSGSDARKVAFMLGRAIGRQEKTTV